MTQRSVQQLVAEGEFRKAVEYLDTKKQLSAAERVVRATLEFYLGDPSRALKSAEALLIEPLDNASRAHALAVCGRSLGRLGNAERGAALLQRAIAQATATSNSLEADFRAQFVQDVLSWFGIEPALAELPRLRESALRSGNGHALAHFHIAQARIAALRGPLGTAAIELDKAERLLQDHPHADTRWVLQHVRTGIASMDGDLANALRHARECLASARAANARSRMGYALGNIANISVMAGDFAGARSCLDECLRILPKASLARFAVLHTGLHLALLTDDESLATEMVDDGLSTIETGATEHSYYRLWFELHRLKWLARREQSPELVRAAETALSPAARLADKELHDRIALLIAEILNRQGRTSQALEVFSAACANNYHATPPYLVELHRVAAVLAAKTSLAVSAESLGIALHLAQSAQLFGLAVGIERTASELGFEPLPASPVESPEFTVLGLGMILSLGRHPLVLGSELCKLIRSAHISDSARIEESRADDHQETPVCSPEASCPKWQSNIRIFLGEDGWTRYWLCAAAPTARERILWAAIERIVAATKALQNNAEVRDGSTTEWFSTTATTQSGIVTAADKSKDLLRTTRKLAYSTITVLITGETGTGKELFARALHDCSPRSAKPFIPFNCSAVSREMLDAQLFGYRKGAFTGAADAFQGVVRAAAGGTLFLDEIGEVALDVQPKLLRFLESSEIHPLGEPRPISVDVRVVPPPTPIWSSSWTRGASAKTCSTASTSSAWKSRRCGSGVRRFRRWCSISSTSAAAKRRRPAFASPTRRWIT
jgi:tetratricopeptide (TPR) repeat protein